MADTRGIVHPQVGLQHFQLRRYPPGPPLAPYVDRLWCVRWDLPPGQHFDQPILAHPCVNLVIQPGRAALYGLPTTVGRQRLTGSGWAVAAMFRAGGIRPFLPTSAHRYLDRSVGLDELWGEPGAALVADLEGRPGADPDRLEQDRSTALQDFLIARAPAEVPPDTADAVAICAIVADDRTLTRVEDLVNRSGIEIRSLQRLFSEQVGLSPKRVIRRYRLLEAAEAAAGGADVVWADVARRLGYSDQAHLTRDFTAAFGVSPGRYSG